MNSSHGETGSQWRLQAREGRGVLGGDEQSGVDGSDRIFERPSLRRVISASRSRLYKGEGP